MVALAQLSLPRDDLSTEFPLQESFCGCQSPRPEDLSHVGKRPHPAKFSEGIVETMAQLLSDHPGCVFDPFAGTGDLRRLESLGPWCVHTVEYEPEWAVWDPLTWLGDARDLPFKSCLLYTSPSPRDRTRSRMPSSA